MNRRLQCIIIQITLLFVLVHCTHISHHFDRLNIRRPMECFYERLSSGEFVSVKMPLKNPGMHTGNYESLIVSSPENKITRDVIIYWENFLKCHEIIQFHYQAYYLIKTHDETFIKIYSDYVHTNYAVFTGLRYDIAYDFEVVSTNKDGASDVSIIYVPSYTDKIKPKKPSWLKKKQLSHRTFELAWENLSLNQVSHDYFRSHRYILHWCENEPNSSTQCNGKMYTATVPISEYHRTVSVPDPSKHYQFGISSEKVIGNKVKMSIGSGMIWETCSSLPNELPEVITIRKVWVAMVSSIYIGLRWKIDCSTMYNIFTTYTVYYCPVISKTNLKCRDNITHSTVGKFPTNNKLPLAIITDLKPATLYMFYIDILPKVSNNIDVTFRTVPTFQSTSH